MASRNHSTVKHALVEMNSPSKSQTYLNYKIKPKANENNSN